MSVKTTIAAFILSWLSMGARAQVPLFTRLKIPGLIIRQSLHIASEGDVEAYVLN